MLSVFAAMDGEGRGRTLAVAYVLGRSRRSTVLRFGGMALTAVRQELGRCDVAEAEANSRSYAALR